MSTPNFDNVNLAPIESLLTNPSVDKVIIHAVDEVYVEIDGQRQASEAQFDSDEQLMAMVKDLCNAGGQEISADNPIVEMDLPDGSKFRAVWSSAGDHEPILVISKG